MLGQWQSGASSPAGCAVSLPLHGLPRSCSSQPGLQGCCSPCAPVHFNLHALCRSQPHEQWSLRGRELQPSPLEPRDVICPPLCWLGRGDTCCCLESPPSWAPSQQAAPPVHREGWTGRRGVWASVARVWRDSGVCRGGAHQAPGLWGVGRARLSQLVTLMPSPFQQDRADHGEPAVGRRLVDRLPGRGGCGLPHRHPYPRLPPAATRWVHPFLPSPSFCRSCCLLGGARGPRLTLLLGAGCWATGRAGRPVQLQPLPGLLPRPRPRSSLSCPGQAPVLPLAPGGPRWCRVPGGLSALRGLAVKVSEGCRPGVQQRQGPPQSCAPRAVATCRLSPQAPGATWP